MGSPFLIVLDTHIWIWWFHGSSELPVSLLRKLESCEDEMGVSAISLWEVAQLVEKRRLNEIDSLTIWYEESLDALGLQVLPISPNIAAEAASLPPKFHRDPADKLNVATDRVHDAFLASVDKKIVAYPHVRLF